MLMSDEAADAVQFQLRFSPALALKPKAKPSIIGGAGVPAVVDPFADPPPAMVIAPLAPSSLVSAPQHVLVLNKFAVVPEHFILTTRAWAPQTHLLDAVDLAAAHACVAAYAAPESEPGSGGLFAFFNSGEHSGASQPHRHLQLLPIARMRDGLDEHDNTAWDVLARRLAGQQKSEAAAVPFKTFAAPIRIGMDGDALRTVYLDLYRQACAAAGVSEEVVREEGEAQISYNLAMTADVMVVAPRAAEGGVVRNKQGEAVGTLALNGTVLAGTALVKTQAEWDALRDDPAQVAAVLGRIGIPWQL